MNGWQTGVHAVFAAVVAGFAITGAAAAQTISPGASVNGQLTSSDARGEGGQYQDVYTLRGRAGQVLRINLDGEAIDTLVRVAGPSNFSAQDDDSGGRLNAQLEITLPANGEYRIIATTFSAGVTGNYTLRVAEIPASQATVTGANGGALRIGQPVRGALTTSDQRGQGGQYQDVYTFTGRAGQSLRVNLEGAGIDTLVRVTGPNGFSQQDDDSGGLLNAQLDVTLPANGQYSVIATTYAADVTGDYTLRVAEFDPRTSAATASATGAIRIGQTVNGALARGDPTRSSGQFADAYTFEGQQGQTIDVRLSSSAYDPFLSITGPGNFQADNDDDMESSAPLRNSRLLVTLPQTGQYRIQATSFATGSTGDYRLSVAQASGAAAAGATQGSSGQVLAFGQAARGRLQQGDGQLRSGEFADAYRFLGQAGQRISIELRSSEFDTYIILRKPDGEQQDNDDGEGIGTNSRVELTLGETGEYHVYATSFRPGETGAYEIVVNDLSTRREAAAAPQTQAGSGARTISPNQTINGALASSDPALDEGQHFDLYTFNGRRGQNVTIDLTSSTFDTYVMLLFPSGEGVEDDDGIPNSTNSRITGGLPEDGLYTVVVTSYAPRATGNYALRLNVGGTSAAAPPAATAAAGRVFLLSVGISDYGGQGDLPYTADDARNLYTALQQSGSLAQGSAVLTDGQATVANFRAAFQRIAAQLGPNDLFFFFYSGHGGQEPARQGSTELDGREEFLVMRDGNIGDDEMGRLFAGLRSRLSIIALDACFSGGFARDVITNPRVMGLFSSDEDLTSAVAGKFQAGGYLSHFLRTGFQGEADENRDGMITAGELHTYLWRRFASEQNIGARSMDGERNYQRLVVDRGGVKIDDVVIALGR